MGAAEGWCTLEVKAAQKRQNLEVRVKVCASGSAARCGGRARNVAVLIWDSCDLSGSFSLGGFLKLISVTLFPVIHVFLHTEDTKEKKNVTISSITPITTLETASVIRKQHSFYCLQEK